MYRAFYKLSEKPFTLLPDPGFLYMSEKHRMAATLLEYGLMNQAGFTVISGDIGAGKTTLIRHLLDNMDRDHTVGLISNTHHSFGELLQWILLAFNLEHAGMTKVEMYQRFVDFIIDEYAHNRSTVLIVDEAQNMSAETLEELRMLSNVNADKDQALQVILVGQNELRDTLRRPDLVQFAQRISVDYHLQPLSEDETANYIRHRLKVAGGRPDIFTDVACQAVHRYSNGVPRLINLLCDNALVYGYAEQKQHIDANLVTQVAKDKQKGGIFPTFEPAQDDDFPAEEPVESSHAVQDTSVSEPFAEAAEEPGYIVKDKHPLEHRRSTAEPSIPLTPETSNSEVQLDDAVTSKSDGELYWEQQLASETPPKKKLKSRRAEKKSLTAAFFKTLRRLWA
jgi:general secretion pathway protein A